MEDEDLDEPVHTGFKYAFLDLKHDEGIQYCSALLRSGDFAHKTLRAAHRESVPKAVLAQRIAEKIDEAEIDGVELMKAFCAQPRQWVAFMARVGPGAHKKHDLNDAKAFLRGEQRKGWFGPWRDDEDPDRHWLVRISQAKHTVEVQEGEPRVPYRVHCHVVAEITPKYAALHWNGFNHNEDDNRERGHQWAYWRRIPKIFLELAQMAKADFQWPTLNNLILHEMMDAYDAKPAFKWDHLRVRSMRAGVSLNARGTAAKRKRSKHDVDIGGLKALSRALAKSAIEAIYDDITKEDIDAADKAVLRTLVKEWGTRSYEFSVKTVPEDEKRFRGHCYFGVSADADEGTEDADDESSGPPDDSKQRDPGPDSFPHILCYQPFGGSRRALDFMLEHLKWRSR